MNETARFAVFLTIVLAIWTAMHAYVVWRIATVPALSDHVPRRLLLVGAALLWLAYPLGRALDRDGLAALSRPLELAGASWMGALFLLVSALLVTDIVTGFGLLLPRLAPALRGAAAALAVLLAGVGLAQGLRAPAVSEHEVRLAGLPPRLDGTVLVQLSDLHLGSLLGERWLRGRIAQVAKLRPDLVAVTGDLVDGDAAHVEALAPALATLRAPLGVWAVTGNHEFYAGLARSLDVLAKGGVRVLRDGWAEVASGLVLAGVDDLTARRQFGDGSDPLPGALADRPPGATILLSHTPWRVREAAAQGVGLMLCGHTHAGQIWPFGYLVSLTYAFLGGRYEVGGMSLVVSRGTGTWGPRMRLWRRSEIVRITLRSAA